MLTRKRFENFHPFVIFIYFVFTLVLSLIIMNPILIGISFLTAIIFNFMLYGVRKTIKSLLYSLPIIIILTMINPLFVHKGETYLFFLNNNPITLEALIFGLCSSLLLMSVFYWFKCFSVTFTADKHIYLFAKTIPKISLLISMTLRFIPKLKKQYHELDDTQKAMGMYTSKSITDRIRFKLRVFSCLITWSLENSIQTADSMSARGYGLKNRSSYTLFKWKISDTLTLFFTSILFIGVIILIALKQLEFNFYPSLSSFSFNPLTLTAFILSFSLLFFASLTEIMENIKWQYLKSKI